jgi:hypothetical protein
MQEQFAKQIQQLKADNNNGTNNINTPEVALPLQVIPAPEERAVEQVSLCTSRGLS